MADGWEQRWLADKTGSIFRSDPVATANLPELVFNAHPAPMWVFDTRSLRFLAVNDAVVIRYGYSRDELLNLTLREVVAAETTEWLLRELASETLLPGTVLTWPHRTKAGVLLPLEAIATPLADPNRQAWLVVGTDITERRRTEAALRQSEEHLRNILAHIPCGVFWKDRALIYLGCNDQFARDCGLSVAGEVVGRTDDDLTTCTDEVELSQSRDLQVIHNGTPLLNVEETRTRPDGMKATLLISRVPMLDTHQRVIGILGVYQDVTELKRLEIQFRQAQKMEAIGRLAGGVAHDFNNLLTIISGNIHLMQSVPSDDPEFPRLLEDVRDAAERAATLTRQLLTFSRKQPTRPEVCDLNAIITEFLSMLRRLIGDRARICTELHEQPIPVKVDRSQIEQVLLNLAVNAKDAMPQGGTITIATTAELGGERWAVLRVADTGCGMTEEVKKHLFEPFFTTKDVGKGTGLGLATVYGIVQKARGTIDVDSTVGVGTTFTIRLPWCDDPPKTSTTLPSSSVATRPNAAVRSILLVEDEERLRKMARFTLEGQGFCVFEADCAHTALQLLTPERSCDLLITDMVMPGMDGRALAAQVRTQRPEIGVVFISGFVPDQERLEGVPGALFLPKPFTPLDLVKTVERALRRWPPASHTASQRRFPGSS
ncbi:MAG: PAS domain S-box protein [Gemmataceae bacterium]|nr:PAS domain S-box protein [Gemmata sp.]MDW8197370.1 PAS domain S-box protein [Gemmataceae bacterium]